ncbi:MAG: phosphoenolpyruvate synthase [Bacteroidetes bacterium GWE2_29_8]|nr:MAG: phosphoenolpyruvate synthase [Bacteroidetes bacterium GWE2_29_8]OFY22161.1 MAG: phosphoenolpyruvate synthase [Bacteroidetes bacterium GWF2_29_10]
MGKKSELTAINKYFFSDTSFKLLMRNRINYILLICSVYDTFTLEEDGRIDELIFNEYVSLSLRFPPVFIKASSEKEAVEILKNQQIDLIITMVSVGNPFKLANNIKVAKPDIPIVVLTPFSREILKKLNLKNQKSIDYIFSWLGNADLLLAITKLMEDKMNIDNDVKEGVQAILLVEDSIRFYSSYLPNIYKTIFIQSKDFMSEGLNEHQQTLRMRGRPKIILATNYEEAVCLYNKYKNNLLGIISDIKYKKDGVIDSKAGIKLCELIKGEDFQIPFLLQSSEPSNKIIADKLGVGFIDKNSKTLAKELKDFIREYFAFGDFVFKDPATNVEINRAINLKDLQKKILDIPSDSLTYHIKRNHFSKWLYARALFPLANLFKHVTFEDFENIEEVRDYLFKTISEYRRNEGMGVIAKFYRNKFDNYLNFTRIGEGSLGGKARGLAFIDSMIKRNKLTYKYDDVTISIPKTVVLSTDVFDEFIEKNNLYNDAISDIPDETILLKFIKAKLPYRIKEDLITFTNFTDNPIAIRSSSLLEDSHYQPFAGIYSTYMIPNNKQDKNLMIKQLSMAIKSVYASVFFKDSKSYMKATSNVIDEEKMAIVLQEVCGNKYGNRFYPNISGVARSINFYPRDPEKPEDGIANIGLGLGKLIVEGGQTLRFSPKYPRKILQLSTTDMALRETQKYFFALDLNSSSFKPSINEAINLFKLKIEEAEADGTLKDIASTYDFESNMVRDGIYEKGKRVITFANILNYDKFPLAEILAEVLHIGQTEMSNPIEIEFAVNLNPPEGCPIFNILQIRPIVENNETIDIDLEKINPADIILKSENSLGNGIINDVSDIIYVKQDNFNPSKNHLIPEIIQNINSKFLKENKNYILIGPGRWGSSDPWLGIPVKWAQISAARVIIESGLDNYQIDPSQGSHFFQNLTSFGIGYFTLNHYIKDGFLDLVFLNEQPAIYEDEFLRHIKLKSSATILINGCKNKGIILKPCKYNKYKK